tara:strand:+ start:148 stop:336 length:189 start_codon:yes stop_codon:yes gene_type:complete
MPENNEKNREQLIDEVIETWDMGDLILFAKMKLNQDYKKDPGLFDEDWISIFGEDDDATFNK